MVFLAVVPARAPGSLGSSVLVAISTVVAGLPEAWQQMMALGQLPSSFLISG